jgi:signal transduction histidine kinase
VYRRRLIEHFKGQTERFECEARYRRSDGGWGWARQHGIAFRDDDGRAYRMTGATGDITEQKELTRKLEEAQVRLNEAIEAISEGFVLYNADMELVICNSVYRAVYQDEHVQNLITPGTRRETITRAAAESGLFPEAAGRVDEWLAEHLHRVQHHEGIREQHLRGDVWLQISNHRTVDGGLVSVYTDITEVKRREAQLAEQLEQQTATSEVLGVISSSPIDVQPVFDMIAESAVRLCDGQFCAVFRFDGELIHFVAQYGLTPEGVEAYRQAWPAPPKRTSAIGRAILSRGIADIPDVEADSEFNHPHVARAVKFRSVIAVPMLHTGRPVGGIAVSRSVAAPFPDKQIELLKTFADQAVIAVENVRLFQELQTRTQQLTRSVEELKALGEVSQAVSSTLDLQTVLTTIVTQAVELCGSDGGIIYEFDEATQTFHVRATHRIAPEYLEVLRATPIRLGEGAVGQAGATRAPVQVEDIRDERQNVAPQVRHIMVRQGYRSLLAIPLLRETRLLGGLVLWRRELGNFPEKVISVLQTFAAQSVLAISNARLFQEIQDKSQQLEITSQHKSQFLANMSHELRTPMNAILGYTELIVDNIYGEVPEKIRETIERIDNSGRHLLHLINDVLDLSKIEAGQLELSLDEYSMKDLVDSVIASVESLGAAKGLTLRTSIPVDLPIGKGDEQRITQVLLNLLGNAIKFTDQGEISVQVSESDSAFVVSVSDTGVGIAEDQQRNIFEEFHQVDDSITRRKGGTGLGLSITKRIIEMHGGQLRVESKPGEGSTFSFTLPVRVEQQTVAA